jgi:hypothetical protein
MRISEGRFLKRGKDKLLSVINLNPHGVIAET